jgi:hypothetical protein
LPSVSSLKIGKVSSFIAVRSLSQGKFKPTRLKLKNRLK